MVLFHDLKRLRFQTDTAKGGLCPFFFFGQFIDALRWVHIQHSVPLRPTTSQTWSRVNSENELSFNCLGSSSGSLVVNLGSRGSVRSIDRKVILRPSDILCSNWVFYQSKCSAVSGPSAFYTKYLADKGLRMLLWLQFFEITHCNG
jgi:hypothetical protein